MLTFRCPPRVVLRCDVCAHDGCPYPAEQRGVLHDVKKSFIITDNDDGLTCVFRAINIGGTITVDPPNESCTPDAEPPALTPTAFPTAPSPPVDPCAEELPDGTECRDGEYCLDGECVAATASTYSCKWFTDCDEPATTDDGQFIAAVDSSKALALCDFDMGLDYCLVKRRKNVVVSPPLTGGGTCFTFGRATQDVSLVWYPDGIGEVGLSARPRY